ncbi:MAG: carbon storage regulator CsrA [Thermoguttaceae bacterium]|nr:carbon storage regulator CsrA [Thermoguttaceae bacterium]
MLVLSRYKDQSIYIGDDIVVTIVDVRGDRIRLGIEAPADVPVHREEIYEAIQRDQIAAQGAVSGSGADYEIKM